MSLTTVTFLSSRSRGMSPDLKLVKNCLSENMDYAAFRYYVNNEVSPNYMVKQGIQYAKNIFCQDLSHIICIDGSLPGKLEPSALNSKRLLLAVPYDYQFKNMLALSGKKKPALLNTFRQFSHILTGSPFTSSLLKNAYQLDDVQIIENICTPLAWDINQPERQQQIREEFLTHFPQMKEKKILSILTFGKLEDEAENPFDNFDLKEFIRQLGEEWFLFTNNQNLLENASMLSAEYCSSFGYIDHVLPFQNLLYLSDTLITNNSMLAACLGSRKKPVYCVQYKENAFEQYMSLHYPDLFVTTSDTLWKSSLTKGTFTETHQKFCETFSYAPLKNPLKMIQELFQEA